MTAPDPDRALRLSALDRYAILDTAPEPAFDDLVLLAAQICDTPVALISLVAADRQWFKARLGFPPCETTIEQSVCRYALQQSGVLVIPDLRLDPRTCGNSLVTDEPHIRFYAGARLVTPGGVALGTLCVIGTEPRPEGLTAAQIVGLEALARQAMAQMELRRVLTVGAEAAIRRSEERLRDALSIRTVGVLFWGPALTLAEVNDAFLRMSGFSREEALGRPWQAFTPEAFHPATRIAIEELAARGESTPYEKQYIRGDGSRWWGLSAARRVGDEVVEFVLDVSAAKQVEERLRGSEERFRTVANLVPDFLWSSDAEGRVTWFSERWYAYTGQSEPDALGHGWRDAIHPEDREQSVASYFTALEQGHPLNREHRIRGRDGTHRWFLVRAEFLRDEADRFLACYGAVTDIDDLRRLRERQGVLVNELQHRARNLLGLVAAVADRTVKQGGSVESFEDRLQALSRAQGLLSQGGNDTVAVGDLVRAELAAHTGGAAQQVSVAGPEVHLRARQVQNFALALHELTTNAVKYGALKDETGHLAVTWTVELDPRGRRRLALRWIESGVSVDPVAATPRGYGTELIQEALVYALQAAVDYRLGADGVRCHIEMPIV